MLMLRLFKAVALLAITGALVSGVAFAPDASLLVFFAVALR